MDNTVSYIICSYNRRSMEANEVNGHGRRDAGSMCGLSHVDDVITSNRLYPLMNIYT